jgi:hypothetical protein
LPDKNTLAYYEHLSITDVKGFIKLGLQVAILSNCFSFYADGSGETSNRVCPWQVFKAELTAMGNFIKHL